MTTDARREPSNDVWAFTVTLLGWCGAHQVATIGASSSLALPHLIYQGDLGGRGVGKGPVSRPKRGGKWSK